MFAGLMFLLLASSVVLFVVLVIVDRSLLISGDGLVILLCTAAMGAFAVFLGSRLLKLPRAWRRFNQVLKGRMPKQIVAGHLTGFGPAESPGICYAFGEQRVNVAPAVLERGVQRHPRRLPAPGGRGADGPARAAASADAVARHAARAAAGRVSDEHASLEFGRGNSDADREAVRNEELSLRKFFYVVALAVLVGSLFWSPLILLAGFLFLLDSCWACAAPGSSARGTSTACAVVEEVVTYRLRTTNSNVATLVHNYRIGA